MRPKIKPVLAWRRRARQAAIRSSWHRLYEETGLIGPSDDAIRLAPKASAPAPLVSGDQHLGDAGAFLRRRFDVSPQIRTSDDPLADPPRGTSS